MKKVNESKFFNFKESELKSHQQSGIKGGGFWSIGAVYAYYDQIVDCGDGDPWLNVGGGLSPCGDGQISVAPDAIAVC